ncbi:hypothetical protein Cni_G15096 [Canna indica]|uniref:Pseudouridine synthase RsuA/RluA-like domain-containing protein n=1 Tax=Canna indica TaxID=4628 RepID=A0AAQ3KDX3_9LILI|nr:hypothetical protein Cni_G15096 [Canna indica]
MTKVALLASHLPRRLLTIPSETLLRQHRMMEVDTERRSVEGSDEVLSGSYYPTPLSPPYPLLSKKVELHRAMSASARSGRYVLSAADIVFEDHYLMVANKPAGVYCEAILSSLSSSSMSSTINVKPELHLANRLDRDTSGLMIITKSHKAAGRLVNAFTEHKVKKTYLALCVGYAPNWNKIRISSGHGRSKFGAWRVYSADDTGRVLPGGSSVKHMVTSFEVLFIDGKGKFREPADHELNEVDAVVVKEKTEREMNFSESSNEILIRAYPQSGRTHQIRLHSQYLGLPIKGDVKYGGVHEWKGIICDTHALHAESLSFNHPITGVPVRIQAPLPLWASEICGHKMEGLYLFAIID